MCAPKMRLLDMNKHLIWLTVVKSLNLHSEQTGEPTIWFVVIFTGMITVINLRRNEAAAKLRTIQSTDAIRYIRSIRGHFVYFV